MAAAVGFVYLHVTLTQVFEGRLWKLPSRIHSGLLAMQRGEPGSARDLARRLERSGYARTETAPERPGEYSMVGARVDAYLRPLAAVGQEEAARRVTVRFVEGQVRSIRDAAGRPLDSVVFEPELLATLYGARQEERQPIALKDVSKTLIDAVLAAEDARFFAHQGIDVPGIVRASWANLREGRIVQGGSTITQQTVKNLFLGQQRTWWRKSREGVLSIMLDARYPKERVLEVYLNEVYFGQRGPVAICGVQAAARFYFGRDVRDLSLAESALLAGLIRSPGSYNPFAHPERALSRRNHVLEAMSRLGLASRAQIDSALDDPLRLASGSGGFTGAAYAVDFVRSQLSELYSAEILEREGLQIHTTIDTRWQEAAEQALQKGLARLEREVPSLRRQGAQRVLQGAVIVTRPDTGAVLAMVGGRDYGKSQFNRAVQALRQPGSSFKPFVFAAALEGGVRENADGITPATLLDDDPLELTSGGRTWRPENYDRQFRGPVSARQALEESLNVPTVRLASRIGLARVIDTARACGIESPLAEVPSLALGTAEVTPLELSTAYGTLARLGERIAPWIVEEVTDREGRALARRRGGSSRAISPEAAFLVDDMLLGVFERGTAASARALGYDEPAAGKTGTTDENRDSWFVGYTPDLLALVWVGYDDNSKTGLTGASGALPIWVDLMLRAPRERSRWFEPPRRVVLRRIDPASGELLSGGCPEWRDEWFAWGTEPTQTCSLHRGGLFRRWFRRFADDQDDEDQEDPRRRPPTRRTSL